MSAALGMIQLRSAGGLEPRSSATEEELLAPVRELLVKLFA